MKASLYIIKASKNAIQALKSIFEDSIREKKASISSIEALESIFEASTGEIDELTIHSSS